MDLNTFNAFTHKENREGIYAEKSLAELQMILTDATKYKDKKAVGLIKAELEARNGAANKSVVEKVATIVKVKKTPKRSKAKLP